jgi:hypothetical protein
MPAIIEAQASDDLAADVLAMLVHNPVTKATNTGEVESLWKDVVGALTYEGRIFISAIDHLYGKVISVFHDNLKFGHFGALKTTVLVSRDLDWSTMDSNVRNYVSGCEVCHRINSLGTSGTRSTCCWKQHHGHWNASPWTSSLTWQSQRCGATTRFTSLWNDCQRWLSTYHARTMSTGRNWPSSSLNMSFGSVASRTT